MYYCIDVCMNISLKMLPKMQYTAHIYYGIVIVKVKIALSIIMES